MKRIRRFEVRGLHIGSEMLEVSRHDSIEAAEKAARDSALRGFFSQVWRIWTDQEGGAEWAEYLCEYQAARREAA